MANRNRPTWTEHPIGTVVGAAAFAYGCYVLLTTGAALLRAVTEP